MVTRADLQYVLELVNQAREVAEVPALSSIPVGARHEPCHCPIAHALPGNKLEVTSEHAIWETFPGDSMPLRIARAWGTRCEGLVDREEHLSELIVNLPREIQMFVREFDAGRWPQFLPADPDLAVE